MPRILIAQCMQEISSFNPQPSEYSNFRVKKGDLLLSHRGLNTALGGALSVFDAQTDVAIIPSIMADAGSAGTLSSDGWNRLSKEILGEIKKRIEEIDGIYVSLHGAMSAENESDPEGWLLNEIRKLAGDTIPIVISLDLHGILTERMIQQVDGFTVYHTYPHVDFADTGSRAAKLLLRLMAGEIKPVIARTVIPALVRGDELITQTGCYGDLIGECQRLERDGSALAAGIMIGNPFTDVPELCTQVLIISDDNEALARALSQKLALEFWPQRFRMQGKLIALDRAIEQARNIEGPVVFKDAADATSSGASGDSNLILKGLIDAKYKKRVLVQIVDAGAAALAHSAGVGAEIDAMIGGTMDTNRFTPLSVKAQVKLLSDGKARLETMKTELSGGPTAVLTFENYTVLVFSKSLSLFDRAMYFANGINPADYDLIVVKSPHTEYHMYDAWIAKSFNIDVPGATSADLRSLGHTQCVRPMYPLDDDVSFEPVVNVYCRGT